MPMARSKRTGSKIKTAAGRMGRTPAFLNGTERTSEKADKAKFVFWAFSEVRNAVRRARVCLTNTKRGQIDSRESRFSGFARAQGATLRGSGALEMIVDGTEKPLGQKEPSSTSPSLL